MALDESGNPLTTDQRGEDRIQFGAIDIGAVEAEFEDVFLLGDVNQNGLVDFDDISPFITLLVTGDFQNEADTNRDGVVDFDDISPFIGLLANGGTAQSSQSILSLQALDGASESPVTAESVVEPAVSSSAAQRTISEPMSISVASPVEVPVAKYTSAAKPIIADTLDSTNSKNVAATSILPSASLVLVNDSVASQGVQKSEALAVESVVASAIPVDTYIGPDSLALVRQVSSAESNSSLDRSEIWESLAPRKSLQGSTKQIDFSLDQHPATDVLIEQSYSSAAELFDAHPESLDEVFEFEF